MYTNLLRQDQKPLFLNIENMTLNKSKIYPAPMTYAIAQGIKKPPPGYDPEYLATLCHYAAVS